MHLLLQRHPCPGCAFSILAIGVRHVVICVGVEAFATLIPEEFKMLSIQEIVRRLELEDVRIEGPVLEEQGMRAFEWWGGEHRPLEELLAFARREREKAGSVSGRRLVGRSHAVWAAS